MESSKWKKFYDSKYNKRMNYRPQSASVYRNAPKEAIVETPKKVSRNTELLVSQQDVPPPI